MANPSPYVVGYSFAGFQANAPATPLPGGRVDTELADIATAVADLVACVEDIRRPDGALKNGAVTLDSLSVGVIAGLANLDAGAAAALDAAVQAVQDNVDADIAALSASKANSTHSHTSLEVSVSAIAGIVGTTVQAVLAELRALGPQTGDVRLSVDDTVASGWVACNDGTIGKSGSAASTRANDDTWPLYNVLWSKVSDTYAPVTGARGLSAAADFAALKPIALTRMLGRALAVSGAGAALTSRAHGSYLGAETVTLDATMIPSHTHVATVTDPTHFHTENTYTGAGAQLGLQNTSGVADANLATSNETASAATGVTVSNANTGGGLAHANVQPTIFLHAFMKL